MQCWRFAGTTPYGETLEYFQCGNVANFSYSGNIAFAVVDGVTADPDQIVFNAGTESLSGADSDSQTNSAYVTLGNCSSCIDHTPYDCLNGACIKSTVYGTPGAYANLSLCQAACGGEVEFSNIQVPFFTGTCDQNGDPVYDLQGISVIKGLEDTEMLKFTELAQIQGEMKCYVDVAPVLDGWLIRPEYQRPQAIYQFAEINGSGNIVGAPKYQITVPHHITDKPDTGLPNYQRGNWEIIFVLKDNSKVTIHAKDEGNGMPVLNVIKQRINADYLVNSYLSKSALVHTNTPIAEINVKNRMVKYYSKGALSSLPDWIKKW